MIIMVKTTANKIYNYACNGILITECLRHCQDNYHHCCRRHHNHHHPLICRRRHHYHSSLVVVVEASEDKDLLLEETAQQQNHKSSRPKRHRSFSVDLPDWTTSRLNHRLNHIQAEPHPDWTTSSPSRCPTPSVTRRVLDRHVGQSSIKQQTQARRITSKISRTSQIYISPAGRDHVIRRGGAMLLWSGFQC